MSSPIKDEHGLLNADHATFPSAYRADFVPYEQRLNADSRWALSEGSLFFEEKGAVQEALRNIAKRLNELNIPYVVVGGLAMFKHGYRRFTEDVDLLVTKDGLRKIHDELDGRGYLPAFKGSKHLRDIEHGVKIEFLVEGQFPGDGKPKPVAFPNPSSVSIELDGVRYLQLAKVVELKLASGMTNPQRKKDLVDVSELIKALDLSQDFQSQLSPFVQQEYDRIWRESQRRFVSLWKNELLTTQAKTLDEMIAMLGAAAPELEAMLADGVTLDPNGGTGDDYVYLVTTDPIIAKKYDMHEESEYWGRDEEEDQADKDKPQ